MYFELPKAKPQDAKLVTYLGQTFPIPANHNWVAVIKLGAAGNDACLVASFGSKPRISQSGVQWEPVDEEFAIIGEIEKIDPTTLIKSLRQVDGLTDNKQILLQNAEELAIKIKDILNSKQSREEMLDDIFCPHHGVVADFFEHSQSILVDMYGVGDEEESVESELGVSPAFADLLKEAAADLLGSLEQVDAQAEAPKAKPRVRVLHATSIEDALNQLAALGELPSGRA